MVNCIFQTVNEWFWLDDTSVYQLYDPRISACLERAYMANEEEVHFSIGKWRYVANISNKSSMWQWNVRTGKTRWIERTTKVKKRKIWVDTTSNSGALVHYPAEWSPQDKDIELFCLHRNSHEYKSVVKQFKTSLTNQTVIKVERVQHRFLWLQYQNQKLAMSSRNKGVVKELELFHGTSSVRPEYIYRSETGFDVRLAKPRGRYGSGSYFAEKASFSNHYAFEVGEVNGYLNCKQVFLVKVLTGLSENDIDINSKRKLPSVRVSQDSTYLNIRYDSVNGISGDSRVHVVYNNFQAYPYYLITYCDGEQLQSSSDEGASCRLM